MACGEIRRRQTSSKKNSEALPVFALLMVSLVLIWDLFVLNMFSRVLVSVPLCTNTWRTVKQPLIKLLEIIRLKYTGFREFTVYCVLHLSAEGVLCAIWILTSLLRKTPRWQQTFPEGTQSTMVLSQCCNNN